MKDQDLQLILLVAVSDMYGHGQLLQQSEMLLLELKLPCGGSCPF